jgi:tetratricopeptide (TPR) repeat protein
VALPLTARFRPFSRTFAGVGTAAIAAAMVLAAPACSRMSAPVTQAAPPSDAVDAASRLRNAQSELERGCYDCLADALVTYESLVDVPAVATEAREGAVRAALLLALRETELGLKPAGYIARARVLLGPADSASPALASLVDIADVIASGPAGFTRAATTDRQLASVLTVSRSQERWATVLRNLMPQDLTASYLWLTLACGTYAYSFPDHDQRESVLAAVASVPLIAYKTATACGLTSSEPLDTQLAAEPRFAELNYHLGLFALGGQTRRLPDLDGADVRFRAAYEWRQDWPTLTLAIANVAMSAEDFERALDFYNRTLALSPDEPDALAGLIRALTYANRNDEAIAAADRLLALGRNPGEAHYWRAMNLARLKREAEAWADVEEASRSLANADVPKLAGILAINRRDFDVARQRLELALGRRRTDCETI